MADPMTNPSLPYFNIKRVADDTSPPLELRAYMSRQSSIGASSSSHESLRDDVSSSFVHYHGYSMVTKDGSDNDHLYIEELGRVLSEEENRMVKERDGSTVSLIELKLNRITRQMECESYRMDLVYDGLEFSDEGYLGVYALKNKEPTNYSFRKGWYAKLWSYRDRTDGICFAIAYPGEA